MPFYDYRCEGCGDFSSLRPMAQCRDPAPCPACGGASPRVLIHAPSLSALSATQRSAHATNERSAHAPKSSSAHGMNCGCCKPGAKSSGRTVRSPSGAKAFPTARPWMISH